MTNQELQASTLTEGLLVCDHIGRQLQAPSPRAGEWLFRDLSLSLTSGKIIALLGPSGAGKSTLLRLLNRLEDPTEGSIFLAGQDIREIPPQTLRQRVGLVMQTPHLFPGSVADNIRFGPRQSGRLLTDQEVDRYLQDVGLPHFATRAETQLSGGEASRVSLARTLANQPEILLLDEPTAALDEQNRLEIEALLQNICRQRGMGILWVTHDLAQAQRVADNLLTLKDGTAQITPRQANT